MNEQSFEVQLVAHGVRIGAVSVPAMTQAEARARIQEIADDILRQMQEQPIPCPWPGGILDAR